MFDFLKKLLPNFEKRRLVSQLNSLNDQIDILLLPTLVVTDESVRELELKTLFKQAQMLEKDANRLLRNRIPASRLTNYSGILIAVTEDVKSKLAFLRKEVDVLFDSNIATSGLSFKQAEVLRLIDLVSFYCKYSMKLIHATMQANTLDAGIKIDSVLAKPEMKWLIEQYANFLRVCDVFTMKEEQFRKAIELTSDLIIAEVENANVLGVSTDPLRLNAFSTPDNWILSIRLLWVEYDTKRYEANKLRLQSVQLQLALLKEKLESGQTDEAIRRQIDYYTNRVKELEYAIHKYEEKAEG